MNLSDDAASDKLPDNAGAGGSVDSVPYYRRWLREVTDNLEKFELGIAVQKLYDFIWDEFCDWYIELVKPRLGTGKNPQNVLIYVLSNVLKLLHPFMPFITEEIYSYLPVSDKRLVVVSDWPQADDSLCFREAEQELETIKNAIKAIRNLRAEMNVPPSKKAKLVVITGAPALFESGDAFFKKLAGASEVVVTADRSAIPENAVSLVVDKAEIFMPQGDLVDREKELARLNAEKKRLEGEIKRVEGKLSNQGFLARARRPLWNRKKRKVKSTAQCWKRY